MPWEIKYDYGVLKEFIEKDKNAIIAFYGGEPLLNTNFIQWVMDNVNAKHFVIQTNGTLVKTLPIKYWLRFDSILLSIDGRKEITDYYRGKGIYDKVIEAARWLKRHGFKGDLIARMTVSKVSNIYQDVTHLINIGLFDHIHWQLDVVWSEKWTNFEKWVSENYLPGIDKLVELFVEKLNEGVILGIVPFLGILRALLFKKNPSPPCGAGSTSFAISTDGRILACPIAVSEDWAYLGDITNTTSLEIKGKVTINEPCISCSYYHVCGGRCLYAYKEKLWGIDGFKKICNITTYTIDKLKMHLNNIKTLLEDNIVKREELYYPKFNNTTEIIP